MKKRSHNPFIIIICLMYIHALINVALCQDTITYAKRLGWNANDRVVIFHVDDAGMSYESNRGTIQALEFGIATSCSIMMPCPWAADITKYACDHLHVDAGLHLTHTAEWSSYRWVPLSGYEGAPGLIDQEGAMWNNVPDVFRHATLNDLAHEIKAQLSRAKTLGLNPSHLDTHMGTLWASTDYVKLFQRVSLTYGIPILLPAGHGTLLRQQLASGPLAGLRKLDDNEDSTKAMQALTQLGEERWKNGLAVVDDLFIMSYDWQLPEQTQPTDDNLRKFKTEKYKQLLSKLTPGITVILVHCADATKDFNTISDSWITRRGDLLSMTDPELKAFIQQQNIQLTNWRELQHRRNKLK
jgi:predicted glycoside hydrolase/deacetylase ChbG (UPF0249 family)